MQEYEKGCAQAMEFKLRYFTKNLEKRLCVIIFKHKNTMKTARNSTKTPRHAAPRLHHNAVLRETRSAGH